MLVAIIGYMLIFMAVDYGRKEDSKYPLFSWKWLIIMTLVVIGTLLIEEGYEKDKPKPRIHIEKQNESSSNVQQTSFNI
jgi:hypothetical protein